MSVYYTDDQVTLYHGDCREVMAQLPTASVDAVCTDAPYELLFMGKGWDGSGIAYDVDMWAQCLRVLKPGGHLLSFGGTRTYHRMACAVEDAGFEIRDSIHWVYGQGFPKSLDVSKAIDKAAGVARTEGEREWSGGARSAGIMGENLGTVTQTKYDTPATPDAARWQGWGTALKPAHEPILVARKPLAGTVAANVLEHGTGAINVDACRAQFASEADRAQAVVPQPTFGVKAEGEGTFEFKAGEGRNGERFEPATAGRWPTNFLLTHTPDCADACAPGCPAAGMDEQSGVRPPGGSIANAGPRQNDVFGKDANPRGDWTAYGDTGGASRYFPVFRFEPKAPTAERPRVDGVGHSTVKPLELMRWLVRLVTPPGGTVLEPFAGSGTTAEACVIEGFRCIAIELDPSHLPLIVARLTKPIQPDLFGSAS